MLISEYFITMNTSCELRLRQYFTIADISKLKALVEQLISKQKETFKIYLGSEKLHKLTNIANRKNKDIVIECVITQFLLDLDSFLDQFPSILIVDEIYYSAGAVCVTLGRVKKEPP